MKKENLKTVRKRSEFEFFEYPSTLVVTPFTKRHVLFFPLRKCITEWILIEYPSGIYTRSHSLYQKLGLVFSLARTYNWADLDQIVFYHILYEFYSWIFREFLKKRILSSSRDLIFFFKVQWCYYKSLASLFSYNNVFLLFELTNIQVKSFYQYFFSLSLILIRLMIH